MIITSMTKVKSCNLKKNKKKNMAPTVIISSTTTTFSSMKNALLSRKQINQLLKDYFSMNFNHNSLHSISTSKTINSAKLLKNWESCSIFQLTLKKTPNGMHITILSPISSTSTRFQTLPQIPTFKTLKISRLQLPAASYPDITSICSRKTLSTRFSQMKMNSLTQSPVINSTQAIFLRFRILSIPIISSIKSSEQSTLIR